MCWRGLRGDETEIGNVLIWIKGLNVYMLRYFVTRAAVIVRWPCIYVVIYALFLAMDWQN